MLMLMLKLTSWVVVYSVGLGLVVREELQRPVLAGGCEAGDGGEEELIEMHSQLWEYKIADENKQNTRWPPQKKFSPILLFGGGLEVGHRERGSAAGSKIVTTMLPGSRYTRAPSLSVFIRSQQGDCRTVALLLNCISLL
jgi:hypothetical protein